MTHDTDGHGCAPEGADASDGGRAKAARDIEMIVAWVSFLALIIVMALAQCGVLVHIDMNDERQRVYSWFAAERYVQLIWVPVYLLLAIWLIRIGNGRKHARKLGHTRFTLIGVLFISTCLVGIGWVFAWAFKNYPSAVPLIGIQTLLVWALWFFSRREDGSFWGWAPFSLWGAWLVVETVTDLARAVTYYVSKDGPIAAGGQSAATIALALILFALACFARFRFDDWLFGLVVLWSMVGAAMRLMDVSKFTAVVVIALAAVCAVFMYIPWKRVSGRLDAIEPRKPKPTPEQRKAAQETSTPHIEDYDGGTHEEALR
ncbi:MAG: hypothetical protein UCI02_04015 [Bifidobacterium criceti]|nr:hypothetical protein [Bifidobacterium criceti]